MRVCRRLVGVSTGAAAVVLLLIEYLHRVPSQQVRLVEPAMEPRQLQSEVPEVQVSNTAPPAQEAMPADIALPTIGSICETPEFAPHSPRINVTVVVFAWRRLASLRRVVDSLLEAEYCGHTMPLKLFIDGGALPSVKTFVDSIEWKHGPVSLHAYNDRTPLGIRGMWINATRPYARTCARTRTHAHAQHPRADAAHLCSTHARMPRTVAHANAHAHKIAARLASAASTQRVLVMMAQGHCGPRAHFAAGGRHRGLALLLLVAAPSCTHL
jgi:hypothetical protein